MTDKTLFEKIEKEKNDLMSLINIYQDAGQKNDELNVQAELQRVNRIESYFKEAVKKLKEVLVIIYGINEENSLKSGVSEELRLQILEMMNGNLTEVSKRIDSIFGEELSK